MPASWDVEVILGGYCVVDAEGKRLAYVYGPDLGGFTGSCSAGIVVLDLSLIHISEPTRHDSGSRMPSSA